MLVSGRGILEVQKMKYRTPPLLSGARQLVTPQERVSHMGRWSIALLVQACFHKHIGYEESEELVNLKSVTVRYKDTYLMCVRADLPEHHKVVAIAHELAHCALGHTVNPTEFQRYPTFLFVQDPEREHEAQIWAAHLLVMEDVYDEEYRGGLLLSQSHTAAERDATAITARRLGIPQETVALWVQHRTTTFPVSPREWLALPVI